MSVNFIVQKWAFLSTTLCIQKYFRVLVHTVHQDSRVSHLVLHEARLVYTYEIWQGYLWNCKVRVKLRFDECEVREKVVMIKGFNCESRKSKVQEKVVASLSNIF